jgi:hypothetical protein
VRTLSPPPPPLHLCTTYVIGVLQRIDQAEADLRVLMSNCLKLKAKVAISADPLSPSTSPASMHYIRDWCVTENRPGGGRPEGVEEHLPQADSQGGHQCGPSLPLHHPCIYTSAQVRLTLAVIYTLDYEEWYHFWYLWLIIIWPTHFLKDYAHRKG